MWLSLNKDYTHTHTVDYTLWLQKKTTPALWKESLISDGPPISTKHIQITTPSHLKNMVINSTNISTHQTITSHLINSLNTKRTWHMIMTLGIQVLSWDRHKHVAGLNWLIGFQPPLYNWISNGNTYRYINRRYKTWTDSHPLKKGIGSVHPRVRPDATFNNI